MADTADLKSVDRLGREGSTPSSGTKLEGLDTLPKGIREFCEGIRQIRQGPLAQSVEHLPRKQAVLGSIPGRPSNSGSVGVTPKIAHP